MRVYLNQSDFFVFRNMVTSLIYHERIMTTTARAKELRRVAEHMITYAKAGKSYHQSVQGRHW